MTLARLWPLAALLALPACGEVITDPIVAGTGGSGGLDAGGGAAGLAGDAGADAPTTICGDGVPEGDEACDDGDGIDGNGCNNDCRLSGTELWTKTFDWKGGDDLARGVAIDGAGAVVVSGKLATSGDGRLVVRRYQTGGALSWSFETGSEQASARGVAVDASGAVYAVGSIADASGIRKLWLGKLDGAGKLAWELQHPGASGKADGYGVASDWTGRVTVGGVIALTAGPNDALVRQNAASGGELWARQVDGPGGGHDAVTDLAVDGDGNVVVVGYVTTLAGDQDVWMRKYSPLGDSLWTRIRPGQSGEDETALAVDLDTQGGFFVSGTAGAAPPRGWVARYDAAARALGGRERGARRRRCAGRQRRGLWLPHRPDDRTRHRGVQVECGGATDMGTATRRRRFGRRVLRGRGGCFRTHRDRRLRHDAGRTSGRVGADLDAVKCARARRRFSSSAPGFSPGSTGFRLGSR
jgi:cysteine-rich repeat protein